VSDDYRAEREQLLQTVRTLAGSVSEPVAEALLSVPRHVFLPDVDAGLAYKNEAIVTKRDAGGVPISSSSQPTIMALMLDQLAAAPGQRVLEIGAGTGYNAALLARIVGPDGAVTSVDIDEDVVAAARENLDRAGFPGVQVVCADGFGGYLVGAPYDRIIATVGVWELAPDWLDQLAPDGRIVVPLDVGGAQVSVVFAGPEWTSLSVVPCGFMRLRGIGAGPEKSAVVDPATRLTLLLPHGASAVPPLDGVPVRVPGQVSVTPREVFGSLAVWLAIREPRWCMVMESADAAEPRFPDPPMMVADSHTTLGLHEPGGVAVLSGTGFLGYGPDGARLAAELADQMAAWDAAGRPPPENLRIAVLPLDSPVEDGAIVIPKRHNKLVLS
jgi:protein-L-isoaspartate(D-aspartate) O-methyltransferase